MDLTDDTKSQNPICKCGRPIGSGKYGECRTCEWGKPGSDYD